MGLKKKEEKRNIAYEYAINNELRDTELLHQPIASCY